LTGCILPLPHTTERSSAIRGEVYDERTHAPIQGAKIFFTEHPRLSCKSDTNGCFHINATYNWHLLYLIGAGNSADWPEGQIWGAFITVSHTNYMPCKFGWNSEFQDAILLKKLGEPSVPRPWLVFNGSGEILQDMGAAQCLKPGDIHVAGHNINSHDPRPNGIHIGFVRRVYDPHVTPVNGFGVGVIRTDINEIKTLRREGLDWEFMIEYRYMEPEVNDAKDTSRFCYRLEFIP